MPEMADAITEEMGAPIWLSKSAQAMIGLVHLKTAAGVLADYAFEHDRGSLHIVREPIGVCGFITPWNWPMNQITCKVARLWPPAARWCSSPAKSPLLRLPLSPRSCTRLACRPACST